MTSYRLDSFARAAMVGLLAAAAPACGDDQSGGRGKGSADEDASGGSIGAGGSEPSGGATAGGTSSGGDASGGAGTGGGANHSGGASGLGGEGGEGGAGAEGVLSSEIILDLSLEDFTALCDEAFGVVETHAHCGGVVTGPGFSYDSTIDVFTEHTCAGYNTCTGFSCVIDE